MSHGDERHHDEEEEPGDDREVNPLPHRRADAVRAVRPGVLRDERGGVPGGDLQHAEEEPVPHDRGERRGHLERVVPRQEHGVDEHLHRHEALADDQRQRELEQFLRAAGRRVLEVERLVSASAGRLRPASAPRRPRPRRPVPNTDRRACRDPARDARSGRARRRGSAIGLKHRSRQGRSVEYPYDPSPFRKRCPTRAGVGSVAAPASSCVDLRRRRRNRPEVRARAGDGSVILCAIPLEAAMFRLAIALLLALPALALRRRIRSSSTATPSRCPQGFTIELAAGADLAPRPIVCDFDEKGRLYVCDSSGSNAKVDGAAREEAAPHRAARRHQRRRQVRQADGATSRT